MIRSVFLLWVLPIGLFWGWYFLSFYDINFGTLFFSRAMNDTVFEVYGSILGLDPATIPALVARAIAVDSLFVLALVAFRRRKQIRAWIVSRREARSAGRCLTARRVRGEAQPAGPAHPAG